MELDILYKCRTRDLLHRENPNPILVKIAYCYHHFVMIHCD